MNPFLPEPTEFSSYSVFSPPARTSLSWGAVFAGGAAALGIFTLLCLLGTALGLSLGQRLNPAQMESASKVWAAGSALIALFVAGAVLARSARLSRRGAMVSGFVLWSLFAVVVALFLSIDLANSFELALGLNFGDDSLTPARIVRLGQKAGFNDEQIARLTEQSIRETMDNITAPATAWWIFAGLVVGLFATWGGTAWGRDKFTRLPKITESSLSPPDETANAA